MSIEQEPVAIRVRNLKKTFNGKQYVLSGLNLEIPKGKITVLIGFSGTGKSVLMRHMMGLERPTSGDIEILGESLANLNDSDLIPIQKKFGVLFQNSALFDDMNAFENVLFPLNEHRRDLSAKEKHEIAEARLKLVGLRTTDFEKLPNELSGGMRKRVGLARAIALDPEILFYDEPTTGLDPIITEMVDNLILETHRHREGLTTVVVTHDLYAAFRFGDYVAMLDAGKILLHGTPKDFYSSEIDLVKRFVSKGVRRE